MSKVTKWWRMNRWTVRVEKEEGGEWVPYDSPLFGKTIFGIFWFLFMSKLDGRVILYRDWTADE